MITEGHAIEAVGWLSAELAGRADAWGGRAPGWFPEPPEWLTLWEKALESTEPEGGFENELTELLNRHSMENNSDTPDYILSKFLMECLAVWQANTRLRDRWFGFTPWDHQKDLTETLPGEASQ